MLTLCRGESRERPDVAYNHHNDAHIPAFVERWGDSARHVDAPDEKEEDTGQTAVTLSGSVWEQGWNAPAPWMRQTFLALDERILGGEGPEITARVKARTTRLIVSAAILEHWRLETHSQAATARLATRR